MAEGVLVIKIGGSTIGQHDTSLEDIVELRRSGARPVLVHGGGRNVTEWVERLGSTAKFVRGLRVTDDQTMQIVTAVLAGLVNKGLVASFRQLGARAVGLSGADDCLLEGSIAEPLLGNVGKVTTVNCELVETLLAQGYIPVVATIGLEPHSGRLLNINADIAAGALATAMKAKSLLFLSDVPGVLDNGGSIIPKMNGEQVRQAISSGIASGGMIPKLQACLQAAEAGVGNLIIINGRQPHALLETLSGRLSGTSIVA